jgi:hypothetical protein
MFVDALRRAEKFTFPVVCMTRTVSGDMRVLVASYVALNRDGWIVTASHVIETMLRHKEDGQRLLENAAALEKFEKGAASRLSAKQRGKERAKLRPNPEWLTHVGYWWVGGGTHTTNVAGEKASDIAVAKVEGFQPEPGMTYPVFRNPVDQLPAGTMVCRIGFPFASVPGVSFDLATGKFEIKADTPQLSPQLSRFPLDGMVTRGIFHGNPPGPMVEFFETSTPALGGQSGGPVVDTDGRVCGITSHTMHSFGFAAKIRRDGREVEEPHYHHTGVALHYREVLRFLQGRGIAVDVAPPGTSGAA